MNIRPCTHLKKIHTVFLLLAFFILVTNEVNAQKLSVIAVTDEWEEAGTIIDNSDLTVDIEYKLTRKECDSISFSGGNNAFRFKINQKKVPLGIDKFLAFKIIYQDCFNRYICKIVNLNIGVKRRNDVWDGVQPLADPNQDYSFRGKKLIVAFTDVKIRSDRDPTKDSECDASNLPKEISTAKQNDRSISQELDISDQERARLQAASRAISRPRKAGLKINGPNGLIVKGQKIKLEISDTSEKDWNWYLEDCDGVLLKSNSNFIEVSPYDETTYFAKPIVNNSNITLCLSYHVIVDTLGEVSKVASDIIATNNGKLCKGEFIKLYPIGGKLGTNAKWQWFANGCSGTPFYEGDTLYTSPENTVNYFVRASGKFNTTDCIAKKVNVIDPQLGNRKISADNENAVCAGTILQFKIQGQKQENERDWKWYDGNQKYISTGDSITYKAFESSKIFARLDGMCVAPLELQSYINIAKKSVNPKFISSKIVNNKTIELSISAGKLQENSRWVWYKNGKIRDKVFGNNDLKIEDNQYQKGDLYFLRAEGLCDTTTFVTVDSVMALPSKIALNIGVVPIDISGTQTSKTLTLSISSIKGRLGWYVRGKYSIGSSVSTSLITNSTDDKIANYSSTTNYYKFVDLSSTSRMSATLGLHLGISKQVFFNIGMGYGARILNWGIQEYFANNNLPISGNSWVKNVNSSPSGIEAETGMTILLNKLNFNFNYSVLGLSSPANTRKFSDLSIGLGFSF